MKKIAALIATLIVGALIVSCSEAPTLGGAVGEFNAIKNNNIALREFIQAMPKGGDLHNHLFGAVYAESWIAWAEEDKMCLDKDALGIRFPGPDGCGALPSVKKALTGDQKLRNELIDKLSLRDFTPSQGWSGHDQFFDTFFSMASMPNRFGDMVADASNLAGRQNVSYLELMHTLELFDTILPMVGGIAMSGDAKADYETLMASEFGKKLPEMVARAIRDTDAAMARKDKLLGCGTENAQPGCSVKVRFLNQDVRTLPASAVYAHAIFGWELMKQDNRFVGTNLVAPEDDYIALRDYSQHMQQLDYLYKTLGPRNVSLHAGELWLGVTHPKELRFHIHDAIKIGHAKRIGHGTDIVFEDGYKDLLNFMKEKEILVEINLTSSDVLLGIKGKAHPFSTYRKAGVPTALSTDDEGVSRIDLSHEYMRAVQEFGLSYTELKALAYNSLKYSFLPKDEKTALIKSLDERFTDFESHY
ncbi:MAG: hypothetical protein V3U57_07255 [Robiginitomaculum sp.]